MEDKMDVFNIFRGLDTPNLIITITTKTDNSLDSFKCMYFSTQVHKKNSPTTDMLI